MYLNQLFQENIPQGVRSMIQQFAVLDVVETTATELSGPGRIELSDEDATGMPAYQEIQVIPTIENGDKAQVAKIYCLRPKPKSNE